MKQVMRHIFLILLIVALIVIIQGSGVSQAQGTGDLEGFRTKLLSILNAYQEVATILQNRSVQGLVAEAQQKVKALTVSDLAVLGQAPPNLSEWSSAVDTLRARVSRAEQSGALSSQSSKAKVPALHPQASTAQSGQGADLASLLDDLPTAPYSSLCGSVRQDTDVVFASEIALFAAEEVREIASRGCDETVVVLGEGGNLSLVCIATDIVFIAVKAAHFGLTFCDGDIDSAEIEGSYDRLGHIHNKINLIIRLQIEENLHRDGGGRISLFYLPASFGGNLELVRDIVAETIQRNLDAGLEIHKADRFLDQGNAFFGSGQYKHAYERYRHAYRLVTKMP